VRTDFGPHPYASATTAIAATTACRRRSIIVGRP
jgi:hypothetical protein